MKKEKKLEDLPLDDGFGNTHPRECPNCHKNTMYICRPGDFRCHICYTESWIVLPLEDVLESISKRSDPPTEKEIKESLDNKKYNKQN